VRFLLFIFSFTLFSISFSQSYKRTNPEDIRKKVLSKTSSVAMSQSLKKMKGFSHFKIVDTTFEIILVKNTVADSIQRMEYKKEILETQLEQNLSLIEKIKLNLVLYPLKKEVFEAEIIDVDKEVLRLYHELELINYNKIKVLETKNMNEVDYYKVTYIGDSKNRDGDPMFWYTTLLYKPNGEIILANFEP
jgi:hypothetical protein